MRADVMGTLFTLLAVPGCGRVWFDPLDVDAGIDVDAGTRCIRQLSATGDHACAVRDDGALFCWGANQDGAIGVGDTLPRNLPTRALIENVSVVSAGEYSTCAITDGPRVACWGRGMDGALGVGDFDRRLLPTLHQVSEVEAIEVSETHGCALSVNGRLSCWGRNDFGEVGDTSAAEHSVPFDTGRRSIVDTAMVDRATCIVDGDGVVRCVGVNGAGQLAQGDLTNRLDYAAVIGLPPIAQIVGGEHEHVCALSVAGDLFCWGSNSHGQIGSGNATSQVTPYQVPLPAPVRSVGVGPFHTCAVASDRAVYCWGANEFGQLGTGLASDSLIPTLASRVNALGASFVEVDAGAGYSCGLTEDERIFCWGNNESGTLGNGMFGGGPDPSQVSLPCL